ncbi:MAG: hypothetical protein P1V21_02705 [Rhizobiaceae bacterium]|nr:hypothetical protein [Rhizobiaceae bacterium]
MEDLRGKLQDNLDRAIHGAQYWDDVCQDVVDLLGARGALLPPTNPHCRGMWMSGTKAMKQGLAEYLSAGWNLTDPRESLLELMVKRGYATDDDVFPDRAKKAEMPFYRNFLRPLDLGNVCTIRIMTPNGYWPLTVHFGNDHPPLTQRDIAMIEAIQPLFESAVKRAFEIAHQRIFEFSEFFKKTDSDVFVFDADGNQCFTIDSQGTIKTQDRLSALLPQEISDSLNADFRTVLTGEPGMSLSKAYQFNEGSKATHVLVIQIPPSLRHFFMAFKACAIRTECTSIEALKHLHLRETYSLSASEISTVDLLSSGKTPAMIADLMSLKATSIRQRLKVIYEKTSVNSQVELVALYGQL